MVKLRLGVLISGRGSNLQALIDACAEEAFPAAIAIVVSNEANAFGLARAAAAGIGTRSSITAPSPTGRRSTRR